jgi:pyruvate dehydrogenase E2 component (dihydrolipoamide acetyltransferase)
VARLLRMPEDAGVILKTFVSAGDDVQVGDPIAVIGEPGEAVADLAALLVTLGVGSGLTPSPAPNGSTEPDRSVESPVLPRVPPPNGVTRTFSSPLARRLAEEAGLALADIPGTGPGGRVVRRDVATAVANPSAPRPTRGADEAGPSSGDGHADQAHSRMRRAIAARLSAANRDIPTFTIQATVRADRLLKMRHRLNARAATRISVTDLIALAVARTHIEVPAMNVVWTPDAVRSFSRVDIALAVATDGGVVTPVLRGVETMRVTEVAAASRDLIERARSGQLRQAEIEGGSITVTNLGPFGTEAFTAVINPPHSAILAVGAARREPVVRGARVVPGTVIRLTLSVDHRPVDGAVAAEWTAALLTRLENPVSILA